MSAVGKILYRVLRDEHAARRGATSMTGSTADHHADRESLSGLEFFRKMIAGEVPPPPMLELLGIRLVEVDEGRVVFTGVGRGALLQRHWASRTAASRRRCSTRRSAARSTR